MSQWIDSAFVTGATGFLGSNFLVAFLGRRIGHAHVLVRGATEKQRRDKLIDALRKAAGSSLDPPGIEALLARIAIVPGDISLPHFGLPAEAMVDLRARAISSFWHFGTSLNFEDHRPEQVRSCNVDGTFNGISMAKEIAAKQFVYVSTAYTCGQQDGRIAEEIHPIERSFSNFYEESKCQAEHLVVRRCAEDGLTLTVLRPSVVIGNSQTKRPAGSTSGLYGFIRELSRLKPVLAGTGETTRLFGMPEGEVNFIPVDALLLDIAGIIDSDGLSDGGVYHLTADRNPTTRRIIEIICEQLDLSRLALTPATTGDVSPVERVLAQKTVFYSSYLSSRKAFDRKLSIQHEVTENDFRGYVIEGIKELRNDMPDAHFEFRHLLATDGLSLNVYSAGDASAPTVLIANAAGMPVEFVRPLSQHLSENFHVLTWESRTLPSAHGYSEAIAVTLDRHVADAAEILAAFGKQAALIIGWCTGARLALRFARQLPAQTRGLVLVNGVYYRTDWERTSFERNMEVVMPRIARNRKYAKVFHRAIFGRSSVGSGQDENEAPPTLNKLLSSTDPELIHLTSIPFHNPDHLFRYARLVSAFALEPASEEELSSPFQTLVVTADGDVTTHPRSSELVASKLPKASLITIEGSDHFALYKDSRCISAISAFVRGTLNS